MNLTNEFDAIDAVSRAIDRIKRRGRFADFTLTNGIELTIKPVPPLLLQAVQEEFQQPDPPVVWMEEKGRDEPNPNDPTYVKEVEALETRQTVATNDLLLAVGTEVKHIPEGYVGPEDDSWIEGVEFAGRLTGTDIKVDRDDKVKRYLAWLRFYALETGPDITLATSLPMSLAGLREGEVQEVMDSFRSIPERRPDSDSQAESGHQNGNNLNRAGRRGRPRSRGA